MITAKKIWEILTSRQRRDAAWLLAFILLGGILETLSIGLVVPALAVMSQPDVGRQYPMLQPWLNRLGNPAQNELVAIGMAVLVGVYLIRTAVLLFLAWWQARFAFRLQASLSQRIFAGYLRQPYTFHLQRNSAELINTAIGKVAGIAGVLQQAFLFIAETFVLVGITAMLVVVEPAGAMVVVAVLGLAGLGFSRGTRTPVIGWGKAFQHHEEARIQHLQQGLGGVKDVKLLGREDDFLAQYARHAIGGARMGQLQATLSALPRIGLEMLAVIGLAALVLLMLSQGRPAEAILPSLGLFAAAAFRVMPSVVRVLSGVQAIRYLRPVIETLHTEIRSLEAAVVPPQGQPLKLRGRLTLEHVTFKYPSTDALVLEDINLSIARGTSVGFVGTSGAGKSTLVDIILGLLTPAGGQVLIDGIDIQTSLRGWQDQLGYVPQSIYLTDDTLRRNVAFGIPDAAIDDAAVARAIHAAQLEEFVRALPLGLETKVGERGVRLSGGQRQRIGIARALYHEPTVLVLDEATSSLDTATELGVIDAVRAMRGEKTIVIVAHRLSTVQYCDRLFRLERGRLVDENNLAASTAPR